MDLRRVLSEHQAVQRARYGTLYVADLVDRLRGRADPEIPPRHARDFVGGGDFRAIGDEFAGYARDLAGLKAGDRVLEVGSGIGRIALPLTRDLDGSGSYDGLEIVPRGVEWCAKHITPRHPNFRFHLVDIHNPTYNRHGTVRAEDYRFPFADDSFDVALLTSVFTHLLPATVENYLSELARVLAPGGRMLGTFYLLNEQSRAALAAGSAAIQFPHEVEGVHVADPYVPENAVAFPEERVRAMLAERGLTVRDPIAYGTWSGRPDGISHQDMVIAVR
jgi:SAM-dependent methyltransferase